jgi:amino-acid N-acetyltransferase
MSELNSVIIRQAQRCDQLPILNLLLHADLPTAGVGEWLDFFFVAETNGVVIGIAGLELHATDGLLRSVAVNEEWRGSGIGRRLTNVVVECARASGLHRLFLLTTTAEKYFELSGFRTTTREAVSEEVRNSVEFREACPASAVAMVLDL